MKKNGWWALCAMVGLAMVLTVGGCSRTGRVPGVSDADTTGAAPSATGMEGRDVSVEDIQALQPKQLRDIHFDFDRFDLTPEARAVLADNAAWLESNPGTAVMIEGHCDERGSTEYNVALGDRRAKSAMNYLVNLGVSAKRLSTISYGEERPTCMSRTEECWGQNRRAHFAVK